jgi:hypothetical protein
MVLKEPANLVWSPEESVVQVHLALVWMVVVAPEVEPV